MVSGKDGHPDRAFLGLVSGSCHIRRVEIVVEHGIYVFFYCFKFSAEQKLDQITCSRDLNHQISF